MFWLWQPNDMGNDMETFFPWIYTDQKQKLQDVALHELYIPCTNTNLLSEHLLVYCMYSNSVFLFGEL